MVVNRAVKVVDVAVALVVSHLRILCADSLLSARPWHGGSIPPYLIQLADCCVRVSFRFEVVAVSCIVRVMPGHHGLTLLFSDVIGDL